MTCHLADECESCVIGDNGIEYTLCCGCEAKINQDEYGDIIDFIFCCTTKETVK